MKPVEVKTTRILDGQISMLDVEGNPRPLIKLNEGTYAGTVYQYGEVKFEYDSNEDLVVNYQIRVLENSGHDTESDHFKNYAGEILSYIIAVTTAESLEDLVDWNDFKLI